MNFRWLQSARSASNLKRAAVLALLPSSLWAQSSAIQEKYATCIDYFTVGDSQCRPQASTPVNAPASNEAPRLLEPDQQAQAKPSQVPDLQTKIDDYLQNYGKPPREFVAFYLDPTPENAVKWVSTYQQMLQRGQALSQAWTQADELYQQMADKNISTSLTGLAPVQGFVVPQAVQPATLPQAVAPVQPVSPVSIGGAQASEVSSRIGAYTGVNGGEAMQIGLNSAPLQLTYYFSATCPYCAKMTPELAELKSNSQSKLELTCVDVTPLGPVVKPDPANIIGKLPCQWRLPVDGEVEQVQVRQTPTLLIKRGDAAPVRLSGYVPLAQLKLYLEGRRVQ